MIRVGVIGGIGSGKSFISKLFKSPVFNADKMESRILMWHGLQDPISPILHMEKMKEELDNNNIPYQAFTMSKLGHTFGQKEDIKAHLPVLKDFLFNEL